MNLRNLGFGALFLVVCMGCGSSATFVDYDKSALRANYRSFDFLPQPAPGAMGPIAESPANRTTIMSSIERNLRRRGLTQKSVEPDLLIAYYAGMKTKVDVSFWGYKYAPDDRYENGTMHADVYEGGTIIIDLVDAKTNVLVWRGWSDGVVIARGKAENTIRATINTIMENYPPR